MAAIADAPPNCDVLKGECGRFVYWPEELKTATATASLSVVLS